jgi:hypothetical protein
MALNMVYMAMETRSFLAGYMPSIKPANEAPTAGAYGDVRVAAVRGLRIRKGAAEGSRRCPRNRVKNRKRRR